MGVVKSVVRSYGTEPFTVVECRLQQSAYTTIARTPSTGSSSRSQSVDSLDFKSRATENKIMKRA